MIAQRFRALGWVAGIACASTGLYLISLQVAAERAKLDAVDARIGAAQRDMQRLKTELSTRASYRQLEKWNDEDLAMAAPRAAQYFKSETQLATLSPDILEPATESVAPRAQLAAASTTASQPPTVVTVSVAPVATAAATPQLRNANFVAGPVAIAAVAKPKHVAAVAVAKPSSDRASDGPVLKTVAAISPAKPRHVTLAMADAKPMRIAIVARPALDSSTLGDLVRAAAKERRTRP